VHDLNSLRLVASWLIGQAGHVLGVAGQQDDRARLGERDHGDQGVERAPMPGEPSAAEQLASRSPPLPVDGDNGDPAECPVHPRVSGPTSKNLGQGRRGYDDDGTAMVRLFGLGPGNWIPAGQLDQAFGVKDQSAS